MSHDPQAYRKWYRENKLAKLEQNEAWRARVGYDAKAANRRYYIRRKANGNRPLVKNTGD